MIYLDNAATTFPKPEDVYIAMDNANRNLAVNAGRGSYKLAREASESIYNTKNELRKLVHADANAAVVFSPSITVALNQVINGIYWQKGATVYVSPYEHNAVARTLHFVSEKYDLNIRFIPIDSETLEVDLEKMKYAFSKEKPFAIVCTHVSNVTGYVLPIKEIFEEGKKYQAITILDSAQSLGLIDIDTKTLNIDILGFAGHKCLYGPFGIGGFINFTGIPLREFITGGTGSDSLNLEMPKGLETKYEASSCNLVAISGLAAALKAIDVKKCYKHEKDLTDYLISGLGKITPIKMFLPRNRFNHVGIVSFVFSGYSSEDIGEILDEDFDIAVRTGYHCAPYIHDYLDDKKSLGTVRIGLGQFNTVEEIDQLLRALEEI